MKRRISLTKFAPAKVRTGPPPKPPNSPKGAPCICMGCKFGEYLDGKITHDQLLLFDFDHDWIEAIK